MLVLKKIKNQLFPDLKMLIKSSYSKKSGRTLHTKLFYNQKLSRLKNEYLLENTISYLKLLDYYGNFQNN